MKSEQGLDILGGLSPRRFLADYWQKKPLFIRQAISPSLVFIDENELAGLACEDGVESRIIRGSAEDNDWRLSHGPFDEQTFAGLGDRNWTLLVQAVDHHFEEIARLKDHFRFLPDWRLDDIMVSFASPGGSVGPHLDQYDVFLLQTRGRRRWQIGERLSEQPALMPHPELQLLQNFDCVDTWILEAGDMLYLPPGVPHWGVALDPCLTCSIGFRAPSHQEIISHYCDDVLASLLPGRLEDPEREWCANPGMIDHKTLAQLHTIVSQLADESQLADWFGRYMTAPKYEGETESASDWEASAAGPGPEDCGTLYLAPASRLAFCEIGGFVTLFADGERYPGSGDNWGEFVKLLCQQHHLERDTRDDWYRDPSIRTTLLKLLQRGVLET